MGEPVPRGERLTVGVPREVAQGERRVAVNPDAVKKMAKAGLEVVVQAGLGADSYTPDSAYEAAGATVAPDAAAVYGRADIVLKVNRPLDAGPAGDEVALLRPDTVLVAFLQPLVNPDLVQRLAEARVTAFSMDAIPRTTRAQSMDALSSQSNLAGYKAVVLAADFLPKIFPLMMTAAGTIAPARALIIGAGVAGLQAIATARRLGAKVEAYDTRPVVKEQVESLGAVFVEVEAPASDTQDAGGYAKEASAELLRRQQEVLAERAIAADFIVTTAAVPGRPAPRLISADTVRKMRPGSVIVDLAAETGGNCELTKPGDITVEHGVTIIGFRNVPSTMPVHATQLYAKNVQNLLDLMVDKGGKLTLNFDDDIVKGTCVTHAGDVVHEATRAALGLGPAPGAAPAEPPPAQEPAAPPAAAQPPSESAPPTGPTASAGAAAGSLAAAEPSRPASGPPTANGATTADPPRPAIDSAGTGAEATGPSAETADDRSATAPPSADEAMPLGPTEGAVPELGDPAAAADLAPPDAETAEPSTGLGDGLPVPGPQEPPAIDAPPQPAEAGGDPAAWSRLRGPAAPELPDLPPDDADESTDEEPASPELTEAQTASWGRFLRRNRPER